MHLLQNKANKSTIKLPFTWQWKARRDFQVNLLHILCPKQSYFLDKPAFSPCDTHIARSFPYPPAWRPITRGAGQLFWLAEGWSNRSQKQWCNTEVSSWWSTARSLPPESQPRCYELSTRTSFHTSFCAIHLSVFIAGTAAGYLPGFWSRWSWYPSLSLKSIIRKPKVLKSGASFKLSHARTHISYIKQNSTNKYSLPQITCK